jgi:PAS domain S-box-containing protein
MHDVLKMGTGRRHQIGNEEAGSSGAPQRESTPPPNSLTSAAGVLIAALAFAAVAVVVFLDELLDLPHLFFGTPPTPFNWPEAGVEVVLVALIATLSIYLLNRSERGRRKAGDALTGEKERLAVTLRSIGDGVIATDVEGNITIVNDAAEELSGWTQIEAMGKPLSQVFHIINEKTRQRCENPAEKVLETGGVIGLANHTVLVARDGTERIVADSGAPIRDEGGNVIGVILVFRDVTEQRRAEQRIEHLNAVLRAIRNVNQLITKEKDRQKLLARTCRNLTEGRGYYSAWIAFLDEGKTASLTAESGLGDEFLPLAEQLKTGDLPYCARRCWDQAGVVLIENAEAECRDCPLRERHSAEWLMSVRLEYQGKVYGLLTVSVAAVFATDEEERKLFQEMAEDIAFALHSIEVEESRRRAEEALRESEERFRLMVSEVKEYAIFMLDPEGRVSSWNEGAQSIKGYSSEEIIGKHFSRFYTEEDVEAGKPEEELKEAIARGRFEDEGWRVRKDGSRFMASAVITALRDPAGELKGFTKVTRDITERKKTEEELRRHREHLEELVEERTRELKQAQEELARNERLAVLGQLAGGVGHELRNPLGAIKNAAYFLNMAIEQAEPEVKETLQILDNEVATSERIISSLLGFARPKPPTLRKVDINKLVQDLLPHIRMPENIEVATELEPLPITLADPDQLGQVFGNIITNGVQAMAEGGRLVIKSRATEPGWAEVSIVDTGSGMPPEAREKIFEPLFTTKAKGIGLGLAVSKTLVEGNRGTIDVESEVGKGSTFTVRLPVSGKESR